ncbi:unnamed protein product, partial [Didymodactylos carnosus]
MHLILISAALMLAIMAQTVSGHHPPVAYGEACVTQGFHNGHKAVDIGSYGAKRVNLYAIWEGTVVSTCNGAGDFNQN